MATGATCEAKCYLNHCAAKKVFCDNPLPPLKYIGVIQRCARTAQCFKNKAYEES